MRSAPLDAFHHAAGVIPARAEVAALYEPDAGHIAAVQRGHVADHVRLESVYLRAQPRERHGKAADIAAGRKHYAGTNVARAAGIVALPYAAVERQRAERGHPESHDAAAV